jgi:predicted RNase H-like HicB family nuclease
MQIPVLVEPVVGNGFVAKSGEPLPLRAEGATREEAVKNLRQLLDRRLTNGAEMKSIEIAPSENPWLAMAGMHDPNDPEIIAWKREMAAYRHEVENDPEYE